MKKTIATQALFKALNILLLLPLFLGISYGQTTINTTYVQNTTVGKSVTFNIENTNTCSITITSMNCNLQLIGLNRWRVLYNKTPVNSNGNSWTQGTIQSGQNGWISGASGSVDVSTSGIQLLSPMGITIPPNTKYGFCISDTSIGYSVLAGNGVDSFKANGVILTTGNNISWGGGSLPTLPTFYPRGLVGGITFINTPSQFSISASPTATCSGDPITFTATATNVGTTPSYQWYLDGNALSGDTLNTFRIGGLSSGDSVYCVLKTNSPCASFPTLTSNTIKPVILNVPTAPTITVRQNPTGSIIAGTTVTFSTNTYLPGSTPTYQWYKNGHLLSTTSNFYTDNALVDGDTISCTLTSSATCAQPNVVSSGVKVHVQLNYCSPTSTCSSNYLTNVQLNTLNHTSTSCNGVNGYIHFTGVGNTTNLIQGNTYTLKVGTSTFNQEGVSAWIDYNQNGLFDSSELVFSNFINTPGITYSAPVTIPQTALTGVTRLRVRSEYNASPSSPCSSYTYGKTEDYDVTILCNPTITLVSNQSQSICAGIAVVFTTSTTNPGTSPTYAWYKNDTLIAGAVDSFYQTNALQNGDSVFCILTSNAACAINPTTATSNPLGFVVNNISYTPISISCPASASGFSPSGQCGSPIFFTAGATGNPQPAISYSQAPGSIFPVGQTVDTVIASNACETQKCTFNVVVTDTTAPVFTTLIADTVLYSVSNLCGTTLKYGPLWATDNCLTTQLIDTGTQIFSYKGKIDTFTVPSGITKITITTIGASGGNGGSAYTAGLGAVMKGSFDVVPGQMLKILVGQMPVGVNSGGGGSFVATMNNIPLIVAGGGGGSGQLDTIAKHGNISTTGGTAICCGIGGSNGNGGVGSNPVYSEGSGGGFYSAGSGGPTTTGNGEAFVNGGLGKGIFGGGGIGSGTFRGGGGGGYSGGAGSAYDANSNGSVGGGGASYNVGFNQVNQGGLNIGNGSVVIHWTNSNVAITQTNGIAPGGIFPVGVTTNTFTASDSSGNMATYFFQVTVVDTIKPQIICPSDTTIAVNNACVATNIVLSNPVAFDNCVLSSVFSNAPSVFPVGTNPISWTAVDLSGNIATCIQKVNVVFTLGTPAVVVTVSPSTTVCGGDAVQFHATAQNFGQNLTYQWYNNGVAIAGATDTVYTIQSLNGTAVVNCVASNSLVCAPTQRLTSNTITVHTNGGSNQTPTISISASPSNTILSKAPVSFTAVATLTGSSPIYQWTLNGNNVGTNSSSYTDSIFNNGDVINCTLISNAACATANTATSNNITIKVLFSNFQPADYVVGQKDFVSNVAAQTQVNTHGPSYSAVSALGVLAVVDQSGYRVMLWNNFKSNGQAADVVVGQTNFTVDSNLLNQRTLEGPNGVAFSPDGQKLLVSDYLHNRVLIWNSIPTVNGQPADVVLGQTNFTSSLGGTSATKMQRPSGIFVAPNGELFVSDGGNNRVLIWKSIPTTNGTAADWVIGQPDFTTSAINITANGLSMPWGVWVAPNGRLLVSDVGNNRILVYNQTPVANGAAADVVIGQPNFTTSTSGAGNIGLASPIGASVSPSGILAIGEYANSRVLLFDSIPTTNNAAARVVLGQPDFNNTTTFYPSGLPTSSNMYHPYNVSFDLYGRLFVAGRDMNRVMVYGKSPTTYADLGISIGGASSAVCQNSDVTITVSLTNNGSNTATGIVATASIPASFVYSSSLASMGTYNPTSGYWKLDSLAAGKTATLTLVGSVVSAKVDTIPAFASILQSNQYDSVLTNNATSTTIIVNTGTPPSGGELDGPLTVGTGSTTTFSLDSVQNATQYNWTVSNAVSYTPTGNQISVTAGNPGDTIILKASASNATCSGSTFIKIVTVICTTPPSSPTVFYQAPVYTGNTLFLSASTIAGATYSWTGPLGFVSTQQNPFVVSVTKPASGVYSVVVNVGGCNSVPTSVTVSVLDSAYYLSGGVRNPAGLTVDGATIYNNNTDSTLSLNGIYSFQGINGGSYNLYGYKNNDSVKANGVDVVDILKIQNHILGKTLLPTPYQLLAADVNADATIDVIDILKIKRLVLGIDTSFTSASSGMNSLWTFVDSNFVFPDTTNPYGQGDTIHVANLSASNNTFSFIAVKLGDVDNSWSNILGNNGSSVYRNKAFSGLLHKKDAFVTNEMVGILYDDINLCGNETVHVPIRIQHCKDLMGMQFTLHFNNKVFDLVGIENKALRFDYNLKKSNEGNIPVLWAEPNNNGVSLEDGSVLFELVLKPKADVDVDGEEISIVGEKSSAFAVDSSMRAYPMVKTRGVMIGVGGVVALGKLR